MSLYTQIIGEGPNLILIHGNGENQTIFNQSLSHLTKHFRCILIDSLGHGKNPRQNSYTYQSMADVLYTHIKALHLKPPIYYYGFSDGGILGLLIAIKDPTLFDAMILSGTNYHYSGITDELTQQMMLRNQEKPHPLLELMLTQPTLSLSDLSKIKTQTHLIVGEFDVIKYQHTLEIHQTISNSTLLVLPNEDHESYVKSDKLGPIIRQILLNT